MTASTETSAIGAALMGTVFVGGNIPAHDETLDLAEEIGNSLEAFRAYVASVRDEEQAKAALIELVAAINVAVVNA